MSGWLEQSSNVSHAQRVGEEQNMSSIKHKESGVINQRKSLGLAEVSRKINKPPVKADKILGLAKINMIY